MDHQIRPVSAWRGWTFGMYPEIHIRSPPRWLSCKWKQRTGAQRRPCSDHASGARRGGQSSDWARPRFHGDLTVGVYLDMLLLLLTSNDPSGPTGPRVMLRSAMFKLYAVGTVHVALALAPFLTTTSSADRAVDLIGKLQGHVAQCQDLQY